MAAKAGKKLAYDPAGMEKIGNDIGLFCGKNPNSPALAALEQAYK